MGSGAPGNPKANAGLTLPPLPYALDALEPHLSRRTLALHHGQHHAGYVEKVRARVSGTPLEFSSLEEIVLHSADLEDQTLFHAAAQSWNHAFYWQSMKPGGGGEAHGDIAPLIEQGFGSHRNFSEEFMAVAVDQFGSGWAWLVLDGDRLRVTATSNAETPLAGSKVPLLVLDVWEHAYYLDYEHRRPKHVAAFLAHLANWEFVNANLRRALRDAGQPAGRRAADGQGAAIT